MEIAKAVRCFCFSYSGWAQEVKGWCRKLGEKATVWTNACWCLLWQLRLPKIGAECRAVKRQRKGGEIGRSGELEALLTVVQPWRIKPGMSWIRVGTRLKNHIFFVNERNEACWDCHCKSILSLDNRFMATLMTATMVPVVVISQELPLWLERSYDGAVQSCKKLWSSKLQPLQHRCGHTIIICDFHSCFQ